MIVQIVIELGVALIGAAQRLIIPLHDLSLLLLQPRDFRLHLTLAVDSIKQDCEHQHHGEDDPGPHQVLVQRERLLLRQGHRSDHAEDDKDRQAPHCPAALPTLPDQHNCAAQHQRARQPNAGQGFQSRRVKKAL